MEIHICYITLIRSKSIRNCSKGIKFFYSNEEPILLCSFATGQITDINDRE
jgi:hypothetical protein